MKAVAIECQKSMVHCETLELSWRVSVNVVAKEKNQSFSAVDTSRSIQWLRYDPEEKNEKILKLDR